MTWAERLPARPTALPRCRPSDVCIVGGGPAGAACALELARAGIAVKVLEHHRFPRRKVCGEYVGPGATQALERLELGPAIEIAGRRLKGVRLSAPQLGAVRLDFSRRALACDRATVDEIVLDAARNAGAEVVWGRVRELIFDGERAAGVVACNANGEPEVHPARFVIGADGAGSLVARKLGVATTRAAGARFAVGGHYRGLGSLDGYVEMYVGGRSYAAFNPLDDERCNAMIVMPASELANLSPDVDAGVARKAAALTNGARDIAAGERLGKRVSVGPLGFAVKQTTAPGVLLVGDAAGLLDPFTGQGVALALHGARAASEAVRAALRRPADEPAAWASYGRTRAIEFSARTRFTRLAKILIDVPPLGRRAARAVRAKPAFAAALLSALDGDSLPGSGLAFLGTLLM